MILKPEELSFLDVYCHEGTEPPFGGPVTRLLASMGVYDGDTLNLQWAYLQDQPPTGPVIGHASDATPPLPWKNREAVLKRDEEIRVIREKHGEGLLPPSTPGVFAANEPLAPMAKVSGR